MNRIVGNESLLDPAGVAAEDVVSGIAEGMEAISASSAVEVRRAEVLDAVGPNAVAARLRVMASMEALLFGSGVAETVVVEVEVVLPGIQPFSPDCIVDVDEAGGASLPRSAGGLVTVECCCCVGVALLDTGKSTGEEFERISGGGCSERCRWLRRYERPRSRLGRVGDDGVAVVECSEEVGGEGMADPSMLYVAAVVLYSDSGSSDICIRRLCHNPAREYQGKLRCFVAQTLLSLSLSALPILKRRGVPYHAGGRPLW